MDILEAKWETFFTEGEIRSSQVNDDMQGNLLQDLNRDVWMASTGMILVTELGACDRNVQKGMPLKGTLGGGGARVELPSLALIDCFRFESLDFKKGQDHKS